MGAKAQQVETATAIRGLCHIPLNGGTIMKLENDCSLPLLKSYQRVRLEEIWTKRIMRRWRKAQRRTSSPKINLSGWSASKGEQRCL